MNIDEDVESMKKSNLQLQSMILGLQNEKIETIRKQMQKNVTVGGYSKFYQNMQQARSRPQSSNIENSSGVTRGESHALRGLIKKKDSDIRVKFAVNEKFDGFRIY